MTEPDEKNVERWARYYAATAGRPPRPTLLRALARFADERPAAQRLALDLGAGTGRDTKAILGAGWRVIAVDREAAALDELAARIAAPDRDRLVLVQADLATWQPPPADLVNASFVLPFVPRPGFDTLWRRMAEALLPGGRLACHLLAERDSWVLDGRCHGVDRAGLDELLGGYVVELIDEEENDGTTPRGEAKHWHLWHINARRPS